MVRRLALAAVLLFWTAGYAVAAWGDFRVGTFAGLWCDYQASFEIQSRPGDAWVFYGRIRIIATGQYDEFMVEQYADNSLYMTRYLAGANAGQTQVVRSSPPYQSYRDGPLKSFFVSSQSGGTGCANSTTSYVIVPE